MVTWGRRPDAGTRHPARAAGEPQDAGREWSHGMDGTRTLLEIVLANGLAEARLRGVFHIAIGRRVTSADGTPLATGATWRALASLLKELKFDKDWGRPLGADPDVVAPRDREKYWYHVIALAKVDGPAARAEAEELTSLLRPLGWIVGPPPTQLPGRPALAAPAAEGTEAESSSKKLKPKPKRK